MSNPPGLKSTVSMPPSLNTRFKDEYDLTLSYSVSTRTQKNKNRDPFKLDQTLKEIKLLKRESLKTSSNSTTIGNSCPSSDEDWMNDPSEDDFDEIFVKKNHVPETLEIVKKSTTKRFGSPAQINFNIKTLKDYFEIKPSSVLSLTPFEPKDLKQEGETKWNIFLQKDLREYKDLVTELYADLSIITQGVKSEEISEVFLVLTSDKASFNKVKSALDSEEKTLVELKVQRKKLPKVGIFLVYMPSFEIPKEIETLGDEMSVTVRIEKF